MVDYAGQCWDSTFLIPLRPLYACFAYSFLPVCTAMSRYIKGSHTAAVDVLSWFLLVTSTLSVLTRLGTKIWIFRNLKRDDYFSIVSLVSVAPGEIARANNRPRCSVPHSLSPCP